MEGPIGFMTISQQLEVSEVRILLGRLAILGGLGHS